MESKCFYCPNPVSPLKTVSYIVAGDKTYPVCAMCDEVVGSITSDD